jgi:tetratricopeptide (TPR) repeat protein
MTRPRATNDRKGSSGRARGLLPLALGMVIGALAMLVGLAQAGRLTPREPEVVVALGQLLDAEHRRVDLLLERGDVAGAIAALEALRRQPWPDHETGGDVGIQLRHDVYGRLLRLRLDHPDVSPVEPAALLELADEGLGEGFRDIDTNPFTARLTALRGEVLEQLDRDDDALGAYEEALDMNRVLLERELQESP